jgi:hypothetical protein
VDSEQFSSAPIVIDTHVAPGFKAGSLSTAQEFAHTEAATRHAACRVRRQAPSLLASIHP